MLSPTAEEKSKAKDGGIIVSNRSRLEAKNASQLEKRDSNPRAEMQVRELSETT